MDSEPKVARLRLPAAYGVSADSPVLPWSSVAERLAESTHYWLSTVGADAIPISRPLDGVWLDGALYFGGSPSTRWRRNLAMNPHACLSLEDATNPIVVEGSVTVGGLDEDLAITVAKASQAKYGWGSVEQYRGDACLFSPRRAVAWMGTFENATRFLFST